MNIAGITSEKTLSTIERMSTSKESTSIKGKTITEETTKPGYIFDRIKRLPSKILLENKKNLFY